jgi:oxygen-dependent protoporphyrinogen oxidase
MAKRVCVIGGGISGLTPAFWLMKAGIKVTLFEKSAAVGGNIRSNHHDGFLYEDGPNSTLTSRDLLDLVDELGITSQIASPLPAARKRYIVRDGHLAALPSDPISLITTKAFSGSAKLGLLKEPFKRDRASGSESVASFFERRLGREIVDYAVDPFISGIYAGDPQKLSIEYAFPKLYASDRDFGSILIGAIRSPKDAAARLPKGTPRSMSFQGGMQTLTNALEDKLSFDIIKNCGELSISRNAAGHLELTSGGGRETYDAVVLSTPAYVSADLIEGFDEDLARELAGIYYPPVSVVYTGFRHNDVGIQPKGFGFLVPGVENRKILGSLWTSSIFPGRAPDGHHLFTTFVGGSRNSELGHGSENEILTIALEELRDLMQTKGDPVFSAVKKWPRAIPQYNLGYGSVVGSIDSFRERNPDIYLCGNYYKGISVSDCVKNGRLVANEISVPAARK